VFRRIWHPPQIVPGAPPSLPAIGSEPLTPRSIGRIVQGLRHRKRGRLSRADTNKKARVAIARKLAVILHRMWVAKAEFRAMPKAAA
jgi:hypothetical protein